MKRTIITNYEGKKFIWEVEGSNEKVAIKDIEENKRFELDGWTRKMLKQRYGVEVTSLKEC